MSLTPVLSAQPIERPRQAVSETAILDFAASELARWTGEERTLVLSVPAPAAPPETLLWVRPPPIPQTMGVLWDPPVGTSFAGIGCSRNSMPSEAVRRTNSPTASAS